MKIEFRTAILISLLTLLWLSIEYAIGLQDRFLSIYPYITLLSLSIPLWCYRYGFTEKRKQLEGHLKFKQALGSGIMITFFSCLLAIAVQYVFLKEINPDFIPTMLAYTINTSHERPEVAAIFINFKAYLFSSVMFTFISGLVITLILAAGMRTAK